MTVFPLSLSALLSTPHGVDVDMDRFAAFSVLGRSLLKLVSGRVLPPNKNQLKRKRLPISPWGPMAMGMKE